MATVEVEFGGETVAIVVPDDRLVADFRGPQGRPPAEVSGLIRAALERPLDFPPLQMAAVPGDRVVIALGNDLDDPGSLVKAVHDELTGAGVEPSDLTVLSALPVPQAFLDALPPGVQAVTHDPDDPKEVAYLANTAGGRRVYLNRRLTDSDLVLPIGRLEYDPLRGHLGPWSAVFPGLTDAETISSARSEPSVRTAPTTPGGTILDEATEVAWLLGCQFQLGLVEGVDGVIDVVGGIGESVIKKGLEAVEAAWGLRVESRAELVIVGVGRKGRPASMEDLARGLATATRLVQRGGRIVVLSQVGGKLGPTVDALRGLESPRGAANAIKGLEAEPDFPVARQLAQSLAWADLYLFSELGPDAVEDLGIVPLERPEEAARLAGMAGSCIVVSHADRARATVLDEVE